MRARTKEDFERQMQNIAELTRNDAESIKSEVQDFARIHGVSLAEAASFYRSCSRLAAAAAMK